MNFGLDPFEYLHADERDLIYWKAIIEKAQELQFKRDRRLANLIVNNVGKLLGGR